jgi:hypothetical protein
MNRTTLYKSIEASNHYYAVMFAQSPSPREQIRAAKQQKIIGILAELKSIEAHLQALEGELGHKYRADQPRVPAGSSTGGQWTSGGYVEQQPKPTPGTPIVNPPSKPDRGVIMNYDDNGEGDGTENNPIYQGEPDLPLEPVYPLENLLGLWAGGALFDSLGGVFDIFGSAADAGALESGADAGASIGGEAASTTENQGLTVHGVLRSSERNISSVDTREAINTATETGNVTTKMGKYGTPQNVYKGSNGTTVVVETSGRNAGKVITVYRH